jgi:hypothetical protein
MKKTEIQPIILEYLKNLIQEIQFIKIDKILTEYKVDNYTIDAVIDLIVNEVKVKLIIEVKALSEPKLIRSAVEQLKEYKKLFKNEENVYCVIGVTYVTENSAKICKEKGVGYVDLSGNCYLNFQNIFIDRRNYPNKNIEKRELRSVFSTKASRILRVMLCDPKKKWQVQELAEKANVSLGGTYKVKERLLNLEYAREENRRILLNNPEGLLSKWAENYSFRKNADKNCYFSAEPKEIEKSIAEKCATNKIGYAFTLFSGASLIAPFARYSKVYVYVKEQINELMNYLGFKQVESGANIVLLSPYDEGVFYNTQDIDGIKVVSNIQLYLDLVSYKGRGEESAEFLLREKIKPLW